MGVVRSAFRVLPALATCLWWQHCGRVDASRILTVVTGKEIQKYADLVNLGIVRGSSQGDFFYILQAIWSLKIYEGTDTVLWADVTASKSNCPTFMPFVQERCHADGSEDLSCTVAMYIGPYGIHLSTQYFQCISLRLAMQSVH